MLPPSKGFRRSSRSIGSVRVIPDGFGVPQARLWIQDGSDIVDAPQQVADFIAVTIVVLIGAAPRLVWMLIVGRAADEVREVADDWMSTRRTSTKRIRQVMSDSNLESPSSSGRSMP